MAEITITFEGEPVRARASESLAAALTAGGIRELRETRSGALRGVFCGMGVCQDCLVEVDGRPNQRACMTKAAEGMAIRRHADFRRLPHQSLPPVTIDAVPVTKPEVLVIGAGPGGLSAAIAARRAGAEVIVVDERSAPGGQFYKQLGIGSSTNALDDPPHPTASRPPSPVLSLSKGGEGFSPPDAQHLDGRKLIDEALRLGVAIHSDVLVWGAFDTGQLAATVSGATLLFEPKRLIVATGAYERGVPAPGWTLPGVMTTGAAQTFWRAARRLPGRRVLIAGNGPLNLQLASELLVGGAEVVAVVEAAQAPSARHAAALADMARISPGLFADGVRYRARLASARSPLLYGSMLAEIETRDGALSARVQRIGESSEGRIFSVDAVCMGYGFEPSNELLRSLGAAHDFDPARGYLVTRRDADCRTSAPAVFALGDCTGLGGAHAALAEGRIAGFSAAADLGHALSPALAQELKQARRDLARHRRFQAALWKLYAAPRFGLELARPDTILCRCEEVSVGEIEAALAEGHASVGNLKRRTRAGMGRCQGRYCAPLLNHLVATRCGRPQDEYSGFAPRVPVKPVTIADLAGAGEL